MILPDSDIYFSLVREKYQKLLVIVQENSAEYISEHWEELKPVEKKPASWVICGDNGYTCGLWQLLHYITVASEELNMRHVEIESLKSLNTATRAKEIIHNIVKYFFSCEHCRSHFLISYDSCEFEHCKDSETDFHALQSWLWKLHNSVTLRIMHEKIKDSAGKDTVGSTRLSMQTADKILWPSALSCHSCRSREPSVFEKGGEDSQTLVSVKQTKSFYIRMGDQLHLVPNYFTLISMGFTKESAEELGVEKFNLFTQGSTINSPFDEARVVSFLHSAYWDNHWQLSGEGSTPSDSQIATFGYVPTASIDSSSLFVSIAVAVCVMVVNFCVHLFPPFFSNIYLKLFCLQSIIFSRQLLISRNRTPSKGNPKSPLLLRSSDSMTQVLSNLSYDKVCIVKVIEVFIYMQFHLFIGIHYA